MKKTGTYLALSILFLFVFAANASALVLFSDNFDGDNTTLSGWQKVAAARVTRYTGTYKVGAASMQLITNCTATTYVKVSPFKNMVLTFKMAGYSLETGEKVVCQYMTGTTWVTAATLSNTQGNGTFVSYSVNIPLATILKIKFSINGNAAADYAYIDDILLSGDRK